MNQSVDKVGGGPSGDTPVTYSPYSVSISKPGSLLNYLCPWKQIMACIVGNRMGTGTLKYLINFAVAGSLLTDMPEADLTCTPGSFKALCDKGTRLEWGKVTWSVLPT